MTDRLAIRLPDGTLVRDDDWRCVADVMRGSHGQGTRRVGELVRLDEHGDVAEVLATAD